MEVTPPSGSQETSAYGPVGTGGELSIENSGNISDPFAVPSSGAQQQSSGTENGSSVDSPQPALPDVPVQSFVEVTPISYQGLPTQRPSIYSSLYNQPSGYQEVRYVTVYRINRSFSNDASAYAYDLVKPPLYIEMDFVPNMTTDIISHSKRTGDKEGMVEYTVERPSRDAWFEMRIYNRLTGEEVLKEGYGKVYSLENKSITLQRAGSYQFDLLGNAIFADITMNLSVNEEALQEFQDVQSMIEESKQASTKISNVFLTLSDLPAGWAAAGDITHTSEIYNSAFTISGSGYKFQQTINRYETVEQAQSAYDQAKTDLLANNPAPLIIGDEGISYSSSLKNGVLFTQGRYLVDVNSYSYPVVALDDLKRYGAIISSRLYSQP